MDNIIMLPTKDASRYGNVLKRIPYYDGESFKPKLELNVTATNTYKNLGFILPQHLYKTSDDEIKEGDWCYVKDIREGFKVKEKAKIFQATKGICYPIADGMDEYLPSICKKIIATTDSSLKVFISTFIDPPLRDKDGNTTKSLPQLTEEEIKEFINKYNK